MFWTLFLEQISDINELGLTKQKNISENLGLIKYMLVSEIKFFQNKLINDTL